MTETLSEDATPPGVQVEPHSQVEADRALINEARGKGKKSLFGAFVKLSGPGWLQSAITLGGGSLTGSLYLGVLAGTGLLWLQPLAMVLGIVMLSAIAYVTLSTGMRPFEAIRRHVNPVLAWAWAVATLMANLVWAMPQFALGTAALQQNLLPGVLGGTDPSQEQTIICVAVIFLLAGVVSWFYESGGKGIKVFELILKAMVGVVVVSFFAVVGLMLAKGQVDIGEMLSGFVPKPSLLWRPADTLTGFIDATSNAEYWRAKIVTDQQKVMLTAAATAVGINMTFLLPYSMLARGWDRDFRGLATFDLSTGLLIPFILATTCVVVAAASQFHANADSPAVVGLIDGNVSEKLGNKNLAGGYEKELDGLLKKQNAGFGDLSDDAKAAARAALPREDKVVAALLVKRDAGNLSGALKGLFGQFADVVFGIGVFGMAISTVIILMLINGFVVCEMLGQPGNSTVHRAGAFLAACTGALGPFIWSGDAKLWLAVPTSMFGYALLPIAYVTFFLMMNSRSLLGEAMPTGGRRVVWNMLMGVAVALTLIGSFWSIYTGGHAVVGFGIVGAIVVGAVLAHFVGGGPREDGGTRTPADAV